MWRGFQSRGLATPVPESDVLNVQRLVSCDSRNSSGDYQVRRLNPQDVCKLPLLVHPTEKWGIARPRRGAIMMTLSILDLSFRKVSTPARRIGIRRL